MDLAFRDIFINIRRFIIISRSRIELRNSIFQKLTFIKSFRKFRIKIIIKTYAF